MVLPESKIYDWLGRSFQVEFYLVKLQQSSLYTNNRTFQKTTLNINFNEWI